jgi:phosphoglycolate phosphatase-like HAD superfamily hydrolase
MYGIIFDLDQTLLDTSIAEQYRRARNWGKVYDLIPMFKVYENLIEIVGGQVDKGLSTCIVTNSPESYCRKVVDYWAIPISNMVCYHDTRRHKPEPEPFLLALDRMKVGSNCTISFGDKNEDITASNSAGIDSVFCSWGADGNSINMDAAYLLDAPNQINDMLEQWMEGKNQIS